MNPACACLLVNEWMMQKHSFVYTRILKLAWRSLCFLPLPPQYMRTWTHEQSLEQLWGQFMSLLPFILQNTIVISHANKLKGLCIKVRFNNRNVLLKGVIWCDFMFSFLFGVIQTRARKIVSPMSRGYCVFQSGCQNLSLPCLTGYLKIQGLKTLQFSFIKLKTIQSCK